MNDLKINPELDLFFERIVDVPPELVWKAWTTPEHLLKWFCPLPWKTVECEIDLKPGGLFHTVMQSPEGQSFPNMGCYLEVEENVRLTWTNALEPGFRPAKQPEKTPGHECAEFQFTATIMLEKHGKGTKYTAIARHAENIAKITHEQMGFEQGWGTALDQLVAMVKTW
ncbi:MAG TPA: SRPBCC family protein [Methylophilaceae bacterium]